MLRRIGPSGQGANPERGDDQTGDDQDYAPGAVGSTWLTKRLAAIERERDRTPERRDAPTDSAKVGREDYADSNEHTTSDDGERRCHVTASAAG